MPVEKCRSGVRPRSLLPIPLRMGQHRAEVGESSTLEAPPARNLVFAWRTSLRAPCLGGPLRILRGAALLILSVFSGSSDGGVAAFLTCAEVRAVVVPSCHSPESAVGAFPEVAPIGSLLRSGPSRPAAMRGLRGGFNTPPTFFVRQIGSSKLGGFRMYSANVNPEFRNPPSKTLPDFTRRPKSRHSISFFAPNFSNFLRRPSSGSPDRITKLS